MNGLFDDDDEGEDNVIGVNLLIMLNKSGVFAKVGDMEVSGTGTGPETGSDPGPVIANDAVVAYDDDDVFDDDDGDSIEMAVIPPQNMVVGDLAGPIDSTDAVISAAATDKLFWSFVCNGDNLSGRWSIPEWIFKLSGDGVELICLFEFDLLRRPATLFKFNKKLLVFWSTCWFVKSILCLVLVICWFICSFCDEDVGDAAGSRGRCCCSFK